MGSVHFHAGVTSPPQQTISKTANGTGRATIVPARAGPGHSKTISPRRASSRWKENGGAGWPRQISRVSWTKIPTSRSAASANAWSGTTSSSPPRLTKAGLGIPSPAHQAHPDSRNAARSVIVCPVHRGRTTSSCPVPLPAAVQCPAAGQGRDGTNGISPARRRPVY